MASEGESALGWRAFPWRAGLLASLLAIAVHLPLLENELVYDDAALIRRLPELCQRAGSRVLLAPRGGTYVLHCVEHALFGEWIAGYRLSSIALHVLATCLAVALSFRLTRSGSVSALAGALFAVHPVHVEAVASIANKKDVVAAVFVFGAAGLWTLRCGRLRYALVALLICAGLSAKEVASIGVLPMLAAYSWLYERGAAGGGGRAFARATILLLPIFLLAAVGFVLVDGQDHVVAAAQVLRAESRGRLDSSSTILATALSCVPQQLGLLFSPVSLSADYVIAPARGLSDPRALLGLALLAVGFVASVRAARARPVDAYAGLWILSMFVPVSNLVVPITHFFVQDRYLYVPSFGACLLAASAAHRLLARARRRAAGGRLVLVPALCVAVVGALGIRSALRAHDWRSSRALWRASVESGNATWRALRELARTEFEQGLYHDAVRSAHGLCHVAPPGEPMLFGLGVLAESHFRLGAYAEAATYYREAARLSPASDTSLGLAKSLLMSGDHEEARRICEQVLASDPGNRAALFLVSKLADGG